MTLGSIDAQVVVGLIVAIIVVVGGVLLSKGFLRILEPTVIRSLGLPPDVTEQPIDPDPDEKYSPKQLILLAMALFGGAFVIVLAYTLVDGWF